MKLIPTDEQNICMNHAIEGRNLAISAFAGAAKTSTCMMIAEAVVKHSLYVCYNKSIQLEAETKFDPWVECRTMHSLAYRAIVPSGYKKKLGGWLDRKDVVNTVPGLSQIPYGKRMVIVNRILEVITLFQQSDSFILEDFANKVGQNDEMLTENVMLFWAKMTSTDSPVHITHDTYLKLFQLSKPDMGYELIYLDECQDANPVILDIVLRQDSQFVLVGDAYQAIYAWRGAVNAFDKVPDDFSRLTLSTSFRFTQEIADTANKVLNKLGCYESIIGKGGASGKKDTAVLVRTNIDLFNKLEDCYNANRKAYVVGDLKDLFSKLYSAKNLQCDGDPSKRYDKQIAAYKTWEELCADTENYPDLKKIVAITSSFGNIHGIITNIKSILAKTPEEADITIATAHKSKGLEWDNVTLEPGFLPEDFIDFPIEDQRRILFDDQAGNLIYVALTRARVNLNLPEDVTDFLKGA